ncbi:uncharacterized protein LOC119666970 [Teleopsis dalmanni]|uniref:uncharacterized protein LOC119666970 n=1 Tax=Teleopsis dalmanni TaxID=139649 RepID=UPI0018CD33AA|nr:uncharacterized protein LOC119666970 [Teleopsis dalmanni]
MLTFFIVTKLLLLKILLASISGLSGYEYGYHPSAEEFDQFLRETSKTWTRDLLANQRRSSWTQTYPKRNDAGDFVPKYNYKNFNNLNTLNKWTEYVQKVTKPTSHNRNEFPDQESASSILHAGNSIGSTLDFTMFSDENNDPTATEIYKVKNPKPMQQHFSESVEFVTNNRPSVGSIASTRPNFFNNQIKQTHGDIVNIEDSTESSKIVNTGNNLSLINAYQNNSEAQFPIFFTNPATGIVYAITEIGKMQNNNTTSNESIPIYITKEQYDRDMYLLRRHYEYNCQSNGLSTENKFLTPTTITSVLSASPNTTGRPHIIRLQKPSNSVTKLFTEKFPSEINKPPPVMVQTELTVNDHVNRPPKTKNKTSTKKKKRKKIKRPIRKPTANTAFKKSQLHTVTKSTIPKIVIGTRTTTIKPSTNTNRLSTQLEKPNIPTRIFNKTPRVSTKKVLRSIKRNIDDIPTIIQSKNKRRKRSLTNINGLTSQVDNARKTSNRTHTHTVWPTTESNIIAKQNPTRIVRQNKYNPKTPRKRKTSKRNKVKNTRQTDIPKRNQTKLLVLTALSRHNSTQETETHNTGTHLFSNSLSNSTDKKTTPKQFHATQENESLGNKTAIKGATSLGNLSNSQKKKRKKKKRKEERGDSGFNIFDLISDEDDDYYDDDDDDASYYENDDDDTPTRRKPPKRNKIKTEVSTEQTESFENSTADDLREESTQQNSSSAEAGADYGAMEEDTNLHIDYNNSEETFDNSDSLKTSSSKKRIRRRPQNSFEDDYDNDYSEENDDNDGGVGGFFRMIFYPVQVVMSKLIDGNNRGSNEDDDDDDDEIKTKYPTYTLYNNAITHDESEETEDNEKNSWSDWFSSWFGFNRQTKKIDDVPIATGNSESPAKTQNKQKEPSWFDLLFGYGGTTDGSKEEENDYDKWFSSWFESKPKTSRRKKATTTTTTTASTPQVPILTIVDPLKNPQNWIGILAHHIINSTSTTTQNPIFQAITRATRTTTTTTENPDLPTRINYDKYQIWRLKPQDEIQEKALEDLKRSEDGIKLQWLKGPSLRGLTDVLVPPKMLIDFQGTLNFEGVAHEVLIFDVGKAIAYEKSREQFVIATTKRPKKQQTKVQPITMSWNKYHGYDDIVKYLEILRMRYPQLVELIHIGRSYEGRPLIVVKIESKDTTTTTTNLDSEEYGNNHAEVKRKKLRLKEKSGEANAVFIEAGIHGLEWIAPATALWMISEVLRIMKNNKDNTKSDFVKQTTWYIMPLLNPDGYVYSHEYDRFWKKSRSRHVTRPSGIINSAMTWLQQKRVTEKICYGVDLDRNWHYQWGKRGSAKSPCNEFYAGPRAFSEPETKSLSDFLMDNRRQIKLYVSMQAYGQIISFPIKANVSYNSNIMDDLNDVAMVGMDGLRKKGSKTRYKIDSARDLVEHRTG